MKYILNAALMVQVKYANIMLDFMYRALSVYAFEAWLVNSIAFQSCAGCFERQALQHSAVASLACILSQVIDVLQLLMYSTSTSPTGNTLIGETSAR
jgi:hypothetical protein